MPTRCCSVRLESLVSISEKAYKAFAFDGSTAIIPKSQVFGRDYDVQSSDAYWISSWILRQKTIQYSSKKQASFDGQGRMIPDIIIERNVPDQIDPVNISADASLIR